MTAFSIILFILLLLYWAFDSLIFTTETEPLTPVDLETLSLEQLRRILDRRGVLHNNLNETNALLNELRESGQLTTGELKESKETIVHLMSNAFVDWFTTEVSFEKSSSLENVLKSQQTIWLILIEPENGTKSIKWPILRQLSRQLYPFAMQFGRFNCSRAVEFCNGHGWKNTSKLALVMPRRNDGQTYHAEIHLLSATMNAENKEIYEVNSVLQQIYALQKDKLVQLLPTKESLKNWEANSKCSAFFLLLTDLAICPFLLTALAAKFNDGTHCFAFGPKSITSISRNSQEGAVYAYKMRDSYGSWQIISPQSHFKIRSKMQSISYTTVTFNNLCEVLQKISPVDNHCQKPTIHSGYYFYSVIMPFSIGDNRLFVMKISHSYGSESVIIRMIEREPFFRYSTMQVARVHIGMIPLALFMAAIGLLQFVLYVACFFKFITSNDPAVLRMADSLAPAATIRNDYYIDEYEDETEIIFDPSDWHKKFFARCNLNRYVSDELLQKIEEYKINIDEIGFPPYNWILQLPTATANDANPRCPICQATTDDEDNLCQLPCQCKDIVYHFDCIAKWLLFRDVQAHKILTEGELYTERTCPICRFDLTTWGVSLVELTTWELNWVAELGWQ